MAALAEMDLDTLTPEQAAAARQALAALETLTAENETLTEEKACLAGENEAQAERIRRLEHLNLELIRLLYGKRSEKLSADERQLAFEELEGASAEVEAAAAPEDPSPRAPKRPRPARNLGHLPAHLPRIEQVIEPESTLCPCGCGEMAQMRPQTLPSPAVAAGHDPTVPALLSPDTAASRSKGVPSRVRRGRPPVFTRTVMRPPAADTWRSPAAVE